MFVVTSALPCPSAMTCISARAMFPRCVQLPMWTCEMCDELAWRPWMTSWTLTLPGGAVTVIVPAAVVLIPLSLKLKPVGVGDGVGLGLAAGAAEGDEEAVVPVPPQAAATTATTAIATHVFKFVESPQICSWRYPSRLLDRPRPLTPLTEVGSPVWGSPRGSYARRQPGRPARRHTR